MRIHLAYGRHGLDVDLPDNVQVIKPRFVPGLADEPAALQAALRRPIASPPLAELDAAGLRRQNITLLNDLGGNSGKAGDRLRPHRPHLRHG